MHNVAKIVAVGVLALVLVLGVLAYSVLRRPAEASAPITAIPLASTSAGTSSPNAAAEASTAASPSPSPSTAASSEADGADASVATAPAGNAAATASEVVVAQIVQAESEARFVIDEVLNDAPKTVLGTTNQVAGEIAVDPQDPSKTRRHDSGECPHAHDRQRLPQPGD